MSPSFTERCLAVIIPVYNEAATVDRVISKVLKQPQVAEVIVVDDGSTDATTGKLEALLAGNDQLRLMRHEINRGKGAALRTAIMQVNAPITIIQDADLEYDPAEYDTLLQPVLTGRADAVFGSRFIGGQAHRVLYFWHMAGNRLLTLLSNMRTNLNLTDMECGHKLFLT